MRLLGPPINVSRHGGRLFLVRAVAGLLLPLIVIFIPISLFGFKLRTKIDPFEAAHVLAFLWSVTAFFEFLPE